MKKKIISLVLLLIVCTLSIVALASYGLCVNQDFLDALYRMNQISEALAKWLESIYRALFG